MSQNAAPPNLTRRKGRGRAGRGRTDHEPAVSTASSRANQWTQGKRPWVEGKGRGDAKPTRGTSAQQSRPAAEVDSDTRVEHFRQASAEINQSVQRHLSSHTGSAAMEDESSDEDEDVDTMDNRAILQSTVNAYTTQHDASSEQLATTAQYLADSCRSGANVCLICISKVKRLDAIWTCSTCYCVLHLACVQKWAKAGPLQNQPMPGDSLPEPASTGWSCPKCRHDRPLSSIPKRYTCFCGKVTDPPFHPWLSPHTCGEMCDRPLRPECGHRCLLLCHPGPCPPCPKMVRYPCYCGSAAPQPRRCSTKAWSCGQTCRKTLPCGQHQCPQPCHTGDCSPCPRTSSQRCLCGKGTAVRQCASPVWQCGRVCDRKLPCGHHSCEVVCHAGQCGQCPRAGRRTCPCGKTSRQLPCYETIPNCGDTCDKLLECGLHKCTRRCHTGPCETCRQPSSKKCRCGQREKSILCSKEYLCDYKCQKMKDCLRHQCKRKCCDGSCPPCEQPCSRHLTCKNHKCPSQCHPGLCYPCQETVSIKCFCESTVNVVPCGGERVAKPPKCTRLCKIPPDCHHSVREPHHCHFKRCPPCKQPCDKLLPDCGHRCPWQCHSAVLTKLVENKGVRVAPWEPVAQTVLTKVDQPCPPCQVPIPTQCLGKHKVEGLPCATARPFFCAKQCGRLLACTNHRCTLNCHKVTGAQDGTMHGPECDSCEESCTKQRPPECTHQCTKPCHLGPCPPCRRNNRQRCHCQMMVLHIECSKWTASDPDERSNLQSCRGPCPSQLACSHLCSRSCHAGECSLVGECTRKVTLRCPCKRKKKEFPCKESGSGRVSCDATCRQLLEKQQQMKDEANTKREDEERQKQQRDQEEYERLTKGKRRRVRHRKEDVLKPSFWQSNKTAILLAVGVVCVLSSALVYVFVLA